VNWTFFDVIHSSTVTTKQLKLIDPFRGLTLKPKLANEIKVCTMHKIICLSFIPGMGLFIGKKVESNLN